MNVETGTEAVQFPEKEYINVIFLAEWDYVTRHFLKLLRIGFGLKKNLSFF